MPKPKVSTTFNAINKMTKPMKSMRQAVKAFAAVTTVAVGLAAVGFKKLISEASKIEDITASFVPMLGGFERANELVGMLNDTAATTPFQLKDIANAATQLLPAMNGDLEKTIETFRMLGDTAGGNVEKLNRISSVFARVLLKNKLETGDLNILTERGIPIYKELSESMGITVAEMSKMATQGKITGDDLTKAFQNMTSEGGVFFKGMEIASKTLTGRLSTLKDNVDLTAAAIGKQLLPTIKPLVDQAIKAAGAIRTWVENNQDLINQRLQDSIEAVKNSVAFLVRLWDSGLIPGLLAGIIAFKTLTTAIALYKTVVVAAKAAQIAFNFAMSANPIGLIIIAVSALIALLVALQVKFKIFTKIGEFFKGMPKLDLAGGQQQAAAALRGRNDASFQGGGVTNRSLVGINIAGLPQGSTVNQQGKAPGVTLNYGYRAGGI